MEWHNRFHKLLISLLLMAAIIIIITKQRNADMKLSVIMLRIHTYKYNIHSVS